MASPVSEQSSEPVQQSSLQLAELTCPVEVALKRIKTGARSAVQRRHQRRVTPGRGGIRAGDALCRETGDIVRPAGFRAGPGKSLPAERLAFYDRADLVAVDV